MNEQLDQDDLTEEMAAVYMPTSDESGNVKVTIKDSDIVKLILEFLHRKQLTSTLANLEQETGLSNGLTESLKLRRLLQNSEYDQAAAQVAENELLIARIRLYECFELSYYYFVSDRTDLRDQLIRSYSAVLMNRSLVDLIDELAKIGQLSALIQRDRTATTSSRFYSIMGGDECLWNLAKNKSKCIERCMACLPPPPLTTPAESVNDRLIQLLVKGLLYEACMEHCQLAATIYNDDDAAATTATESSPSTTALMCNSTKTVKVLSETSLSDMDASLLSWLQFIPAETFSCSFAQRCLSLFNIRLKTEHSSRKSLPPPPPLPSPPQFPQSPPSSRTFDSVENINTNTVASNNNSDRTSSSSPEKRRVVYYRASHLQDAQAIRALAIHPTQSQYFAVGSNSAVLRMCLWPPTAAATAAAKPTPIHVLSKYDSYHSGSIYCLNWHPTGRLLASGSNDKTIKLVNFSTGHLGTTSQLNIHNGTVRDLLFLGSSGDLLVSAGAGDCRIHVTDVITRQLITSLTSHQGHIFCLGQSSNSTVISGSFDRTIRVWDLRSQSGEVSCTQTPAPVAALDVSPPPNEYLVSAHEDSKILCWDMRMISSQRPLANLNSSHSGQVRSVRFGSSTESTSPGFIPCVLSASYDKTIRIGSLGGGGGSVVVGRHSDKAVQAKWHPLERDSFVSTSADRTCVVWRKGDQVLTGRDAEADYGGGE